MRHPTALPIGIASSEVLTDAEQCFTGRLWWCDMRCNRISRWLVVVRRSFYRRYAHQPGRQSTRSLCFQFNRPQRCNARAATRAAAYRGQEEERVERPQAADPCES